MKNFTIYCTLTSTVTAIANKSATWTLVWQGTVSCQPPAKWLGGHHNEAGCMLRGMVMECCGENKATPGEIKATLGAIKAIPGTT